MLLGELASVSENAPVFAEDTLNNVTEKVTDVLPAAMLTISTFETSQVADVLTWDLKLWRKDVSKAASSKALMDKSAKDTVDVTTGTSVGEKVGATDGEAVSRVCGRRGSANRGCLRWD